MKQIAPIRRISQENRKEEGKLNCTYCGKKMETGIIRSDGSPGLFYMPEGEDFLFGRIITKEEIENKGGIILDGPYITRLHSLRIDCYACKSCRKIVVSY